MYKRKIKQELLKQWTYYWEKMSKAIEENILRVKVEHIFMRIQFILETYVYI